MVDQSTLERFWWLKLQGTDARASKPTNTVKSYLQLFDCQHLVIPCAACAPYAPEMVLLTMTPSIVEALQFVRESEGAPAIQDSKSEEASDKATTTDVSTEPSLESAVAGKPISHGQVIDLWKQLKSEGHSKYSLEDLLRGATVYIPPPSPKPEPVRTPCSPSQLPSVPDNRIANANTLLLQTPQYKALMERLRRDEEERSYERMLKNGPIRETFGQRFPNAPPLSLVESFAAANRVQQKSDLGEETISQEEVQQQITLIINFLISIAGCAAALWIAARWWSTPARLFLALGGSIVVAIAEVAVYNAYQWRMAQGDKKQQAKKEVRSIVKTWIVGEEEEASKEGYEPVLIPPPMEDDAKQTADQNQELRKRTIPTT